MAWIVQPRQLRDGGRWRLVAESDEGGGFHEACEGHDHATPDEASACPLGQSAADVITGIPARILAKAEREDGCVVSVGGLVTDMDELAALRAENAALKEQIRQNNDDASRIISELRAALKAYVFMEQTEGGKKRRPAMRDPRVDPKPGDVVSYRDKPQRRIEEVFTDACGDKWVTYTIRKQMPVSRWKRSVRYAEVIHVAD